MGTHNPYFYKYGPKKEINLPPPSPTPTEDDIYWEKDDINPNQVIYDLENNNVIVPSSDEEIVVTPQPKRYENEMIVRDVSSTRYRKNR